jgi:mannose-6-phosphate isomerase-like protein (cupin superfamily)
MKKTVLIAAGLILAGIPAWSQTPAPAPAPARGARAPQANWWSAPGREDGPPRIVWAAQKDPETPYDGPNKPIWHIADILKAHAGQKSWDQPVLLTRDFDGHYIQMAPGEKTKCMFYADDRVFGWIYSGQVKVTIDGQQPTTLSKGWVFNVAPRLSYCFENTGTEPVVFYRTTPAKQAPSYPESETPTPMKGYKYIKARITSTGGYDSFNVPFFNVEEYGASGKTGGRYLYDGHTSSNLNLASNTELPPDTNWGHFHENMVEAWVDVYGNVCALISGVGLVQGVQGDVIVANEERWHRATSCPNSPTRSIRMAMTPRSKEGQVHYFQTDVNSPGE